MQDNVNPFPNMVIDDSSFLDTSLSRTKCLKCNKSRKYYCYSCCIALPHLEENLPKVKLPLKVDIIKHPGELDGKSTAPHASILAPNDVTIHTYPCIPDYQLDKVIVVFPCEDSITLDELKSCGSHDHLSTLSSDDFGQENSLDINTKHNNSNDTSSNLSHKHTSLSKQRFLSDSVAGLKRKRPVNENEQEEKESDFREDLMKHQKITLKNNPFERVVFIDCTWNQTKNIIDDERLKGLRKVELKSQTTNFWRTQAGFPKTYLSTIEAIYYFFKDFHTIFLDPDYNNEYDNLLFFFCFMYNKIKEQTKNSQEK